ncbi:MAG: methylenetetrahydrofolate reductase [Actinomycetota bacterium]
MAAERGMSAQLPRGAREMLERPRFELVPVKGADAEIDHLPAGAHVAVTCSPTRGIDNTLALSERLQDRGFAAIPHISARLVEDEGRAERIVRRVIDGGIGDLFVIGGDVERPAGPFASALSLLTVIRALGYQGAIGIAAYPEAHPLIGADEVWRALCDKEPFATYIVSQICFDPVRIVAWLGEVRRRGIDLPLWVGFPGVVERNKLMRVALRIGVGASTRFLTKHGNLVTRLVRRGGYNPNELVQGLAPHVMDCGLKVAGYHINTFNQVAPTERWRKGSLDAVPGPSDSSAARS